MYITQTESSVGNARQPKVIAVSSQYTCKCTNKTAQANILK